MRASRGAENGPKSHPASTGTKFRERAKRGLNRSKNAFSGRKICKNERGRNSCHPDSQARERFVPDCAENAEDPSLHLAHRRRRRVRPRCGKGEGAQRLGRRRFHDPEGGSGFFAGASGGAPMKKAPPDGGALCERMLPSRRTGGRSVIWPASSRCRPAGRRCGRRSRCRPGRCRRDGCRRERRP